MAARSGKALLAGVIGFPVSHSLSPALHEYWLQKYTIDGAYIPLSIAPENLTTSIHHLVQLGFQGFNITLPHKESIMPLLASIDDTARQIGAVNTVAIRDGQLHGFNTDAYGFIQHLKHTCPYNLDFTHMHALVLGAGGASRAVCTGLLHEGCPTIYLCNRNKQRAEDLVQHLKMFPSAQNTQFIIMDWEELSHALPAPIDLLINTTQLGMTGQPPLTIDLKSLPAHALVYDIVYRPLLTPLLQQAQHYGLKTIDGLGMLLWQAQQGFELWFKEKPEITPELHNAILSLAEST